MEIEIVKFVQNWANKFLDVFLWLITKLGEETVFLFLLAMIYICYNKMFAIKFSYYYLISVAFNSFMKICAKRPRPHVFSADVVNRLPAGGYSFPSGHTQGYFVNATTGMMEINKKSKRNKLKICLLFVLGLLGILVMISRLYWGQHYLTDVLVGMMFGLSIPFALDWFIQILPNSIKNFFTVDKMYLILGILGGLVFLVLLPLEFAIGFVSNKAYKFVAVFIAMSIGYFVDKKCIHYNSYQGFKIGVIKIIISLFVLVGLYILLQLIIPIKGYICFLVYLFLGLICTIILPILFKLIFRKVDNEKYNNK